jgi:hypothetical protein
LAEIRERTQWENLIERAHPAHPTKSYSFTSIDVPSASLTVVLAFNDRGEVAGPYSNSSGAHSFV